MTGVELVNIVRARLAEGKPVRRTLAGGGRLHVDRPLPFLCVYRPPHDRDDLGTADLVRTQASYLIAPKAPERAEEVRSLIAGVVDVLATSCGACLVLELWSGDDAAAASPPTFRIRTANRDRLATTIDALADALRTMTLPVTSLEVEVIAAEEAAPAGRPPLVEAALAARSSTHARHERPCGRSRSRRAARYRR